MQRTGKDVQSQQRQNYERKRPDTVDRMLQKLNYEQSVDRWEKRREWRAAQGLWQCTDCGQLVDERHWARHEKERCPGVRQQA